MPIRVALHHKTTYFYDRPVTLSPQVVRLRPAPHSRTPIPAYSLKIEPGGHFINWQQDPQSNWLARIIFHEKVRQFSVEVDLVAEMVVINPFDFFLEPNAEEFPLVYDAGLQQELAPFRLVDSAGPLLNEFIATVNVTKRRTIDFLVDLNQLVQRRVNYAIRMEPGVQSPEETLRKHMGSCRDSAWLLVQACRQLGLAARFVSGYLIQLKPDVKPLEGPAGTAVDFTDLHAWTEVYLPGAGWIGLDPTSGLFAGEGHIPLAATPEPSSAAPVSGGVDECKVEFAHVMEITRIHEDPRVTLPYTDDQWREIEALGYQVDRDLVDHDVRLTMGGEPTFVSVEDMDGDEWNTAAMGPNKRRLAMELIDRLRKRLAPGGLLHMGQGKWYPGEPLPRWAFTCYWREDGQPLWNNPALLALDGVDQGYGPADAQAFAAKLAERLGVSPDYVNTAYEDPVFYLEKERQLPINVDPENNRLEDPQERERIRRVFEHGLHNPTGFVLPLQRTWTQRGPEWQTGLWMLRGAKIFLIPGDSAVGYRLPLASLPWAESGPLPNIITVDPMAQRPALPPSRAEIRMQHAPYVAPPVDKKPKAGESADWVVRTALCIEPRNGQLHIFLPPMASVDDYVDLVGAIEETATLLRMPVIFEGYTLPPDHRIKYVRVTPDPGVIEVNVQPSDSWSDLVRHTTELYDDAHQCRLGTEKFMLDGRHCGTGGGNHIVLGGRTPNDSPFLRRPDLLRSLLSYWVNHPSLSYLFSGMFIGPTSQAPRVDETRADSLYELEIAFSQVPPAGGAAIPNWLVDRIFRHILTDLTGNTHRAEFCIDKLFSPDSSTGRLGLLELRGFEMPPHARMSLTQQLLVRTLIAHFWKTPYLQSPVAWGTQLHDQFMLPHFVNRDIASVMDDLRAAGYRFRTEWFAPHFEFRYPVFGRVNYLGIEIELRQATEPWYVLGEEPAGGGTSRFVDSSVERLQVTATGMFGNRYLITCNGRRVPLHSTGVQGGWVAGVRYRAWQPPSCLHPTIPVHTPLVFDLYDTWTGRSVGGCSYHVSHPGGRASEQFPINALEAESRRGARFFGFGHTPGPRPMPPVESNPLFPLTLDLRR